MNGRTNSTDSRANDLQIPLDPCTNLVATAGNGQVSLSWTDPLDMYATPEGAIAQDSQQLVAKWSHTLVVRNTDHQPENPDDGTIILMSSVRNQYQTNGYVDNTVENGTPYHYGGFAISTANVTSDGAFTSATPIAGTPLAELAEGTLIKILENGTPVEFYLAKHNYEPTLNGEGRELMVRKDCTNDNQMYTRYSSNIFSNSYILSYLDSTYVGLFSSYTQGLIATTAFYSASNPSDNNSPVVSIRHKAFLLSATELDFDGNDVYGDWFTEGSPLTNGKFYWTAYMPDAGNYEWFTRSGRRNDNNEVWVVRSDGSDTDTVTVFAHEYGYGCRPCFSLPSTAMIDTDLNLIEEVV